MSQTQSYLELQVKFVTPIFISMEEEPEELEVIIRDGSIFLSNDGLPLKLANKSNLRELKSKNDLLIEYEEQ